MKRKIVYTFIIFVIISFIITGKAYARITTNDPTVNSGETVTINISSQEPVSSGAINIKSNSGLIFNSVSGGTSNGKLVAFSKTENITSGIATYKFTAPTVNEVTTYKIIFESKDMAKADGANINNSEATATVTVKPITTSTTNNTNTSTSTTKSNNANLKTLGVTPKEYDFSGFSKTKTEYSVTVPANVDSLKVAYKTEDANAKVKVSGNTGLETGSDNNIKILVTAEDGKTTKTYTIKVTKLATEEEKPGNVIDDDKGIYLTSLLIKDLKLSPNFSKDVYSYIADATADVNEVEIEAKANNEKAKVDITGNTNLVEGENIINILVSLEGSAEQTVYQITLTKAATTDSAITTGIDTDKNSSSNTFMQSWGKYVLIVGLAVVLIILAIILLVYLIKKENKRLSEEDNEEEIEPKGRFINDAKEYDVFKNDTNEFNKNDNQKNNFIESLYKQRNGELYNQEELDEEDKENIEEINRETDKIFREKVKGQSVEYTSNEFDNEEDSTEDKTKRKGRHF